MASGGEDWEKIDAFKEKYQHPCGARRAGDLARKMGGHGGMDYIMTFA